MSIKYFNEKEQVKKRQPHKRKAEKVIKKETVQVIFEKFIDFELKQNLRPATLNKLITNFKGVE
jgi:integrase/recombinase XerD